MEGRLGRFIERIRSTTAPKQDLAIKIIIPEEVDLEDASDLEKLIWGERVRVSEIRNPEVVESLFQENLIIGQTILPWEGVAEMEIYSRRTVYDGLIDRFAKPTSQAVEEEKQRLKEFAGI